LPLPPVVGLGAGVDVDPRERFQRSSNVALAVDAGGDETWGFGEEIGFDRGEMMPEDEDTGDMIPEEEYDGARCD